MYPKIKLELWSNILILRIFLFSEYPFLEYFSFFNIILEIILEWQNGVKILTTTCINGLGQLDVHSMDDTQVKPINL